MNKARAEKNSKIEQIEPISAKISEIFGYSMNIFVWICPTLYAKAK